MKVTILIPTYNRAALISKTIENCFLQTYNDFDILVYDDGSTDNTDTVIKSLQTVYPNRIKYIKSTSNKGIGYSRNMLLKNLNTEYGVWLDSDDLMSSDRLLKCINYLESNIDVDIVFSYITKFHSDNINPNELQKSDIKINVSTYNKNNYRSLHSNTACATGFFRQKLKRYNIVPLKYGSEDVLWLWQLLNAGINIGQISEPLYFYRSHVKRLGVYKKGIYKNAKVEEESIIAEKIKEYMNG